MNKESDDYANFILEALGPELSQRAKISIIRREDSPGEVQIIVGNLCPDVAEALQRLVEVNQPLSERVYFMICE